jgi:hypothetical protein
VKEEVTRSRLSLLGCLALLAGCGRETPTEPNASYPEHLYIQCLPAGRDLACASVVYPTSAPVTSNVTTWLSSDRSMGSFGGGDGTPLVPIRFVPARRGEVTLWAHAELQVRGRTYALDSGRWSFLVDPVSDAKSLYPLYGSVRDGATKAPIGGAEVRILDGYAQGKRAIADSFGSFRIDDVLTNQTFSASASAPGYQPQTQSCRVSSPNVPDGGAGGSTAADFLLIRSP